MADNVHHSGDPAEIEVVGAYDQDIADHSVCRPLPEWYVADVKGLTSREQVRQYLLSLSDEDLMRFFRHIQYRYLADGTLWDMSVYWDVRRMVEPPEKIHPAGVQALPDVDAEFAVHYARGWRPLPPPKETDNPCETCAGHGICPNCMGSGSA